MAKTLEAVVRRRWLPPKYAVREVVAFERRFGEKHLALACHAALPLILTPELVNLIRINFLDAKDIPWIAESDLLLSPLCRPIQEGVYEVEPTIREVLLVELEDKFGWRKPFELAEFLEFYLEKQPDWKQRPELTRTQKWIAQAYLDPDSTVREIKDRLDESLPKDNPILGLPEQSYIPHLVEILAEPLERTNLWDEHQYLVNDTRVLAKLISGEREELKQELREEKIVTKTFERESIMISPSITKLLQNLELDVTQNTPSNLRIIGSANFIGRENQLEELHQLLQQNKQATIVAIVGMGGIGKTELALQYALKYKDNYPGSLCWFSVRRENLVTQIIEFAGTYLDIFAPQELESDQAKVRYCWINWRSEPSLIVLDDVPNYGQFYRENIAPYLPPATSNIKVLVTSRERPPRSIPHLDLNELVESAALELLESLIGKSRIEAELELANELCKWLGYLPLGLNLVGRYIALDETLTIEKTLKRLEKQKLKSRALLNPQQAGMIAQFSMENALDLSWEVLSPKAQELCCYLSLFTAEPFKWSWVETAWMESEDEDEREEEIEDLEDLEALRNLQLNQRNLLKAVPDSQAPTEYNYQLHSLIAQYFQARLEETEQAIELKHKFCQPLIEIAQSIHETPTQEDIQATTLAICHLSFMATELSEYIDDDNLIVPYVGLGRFYGGQGLYSQAEKWYELSLTTCQERLGTKHPDVATSLNNLAYLYSSQGRYEEAEPLYLQALELSRQVLGTEHPDVATSLNNLAYLYSSQGRYEEAEPLYLQALELSRQVLGTEHPDVATSLNNLAYLYSSQGRYDEAEPLYLQALNIKRKLLRADHPDVATSLNNLAGLYRSQGRYKEAEALYQQALGIYQKLLGTDHPNVATSINNLAGLYLSQGRYKEAELLYKRALEIRQKLLGADHPDVAISLNNLAELYNLQGGYNKAETLYLKALELNRKLLGEEHPNVATSLNNLANLYSNQEKYDEAETLYLQALELNRKLLGEKHPNVTNSLNNLSNFYSDKGIYLRDENMPERHININQGNYNENIQGDYIQGNKGDYVFNSGAEAFKLNHLNNQITNTINQLPSFANKPDKQELKDLLTQLQTEVLESVLEEYEREEALEQILALAEGLSSYKDGIMKKKNKRAIIFLRGIAADLPPDSKIVNICDSLPDLINKIF